MKNIDAQTGPLRLPDSGGLAGPAWRSFVRPALERLLGLRQLQHLYERIRTDEGSGGFWARALRQMEARVAPSGAPLQAAIGDGGAIVVANHPFGGPEAIALGALLEELRPDVRFLANGLLRRIPELRDRIIEADVFHQQGAVASNAASMRTAIRWVRRGHVLVIFPAGEVSHWRSDLGAVADRDWDASVGGLIRLAQAPVVPIHFAGSNGALFSAAGVVHPLLRTAMLPRALLRQRGRTIALRVGRPIPTDRVNRCGSNAALAAFLRFRTYALAGTSTGGEQRPAVAGAPVADATPAASIRAELAALPADRTLARQGAMRAVLAEADEIPEGMLEIGRLREVAFRAVQEGVGQARDLDRHDAAYQHLLVWDDEAERIAGCYRIGATDRILNRLGPDGLYTSSLFEIERSLLEDLGPALELGRSFVHPDYQRHFAPLMLLWKGIGAFVVQHPQYRYLFGPVSISASYRDTSKGVLMDFLERAHGAPALAERVRARRPARHHGQLRCRPEDLAASVRDLADVDAVMRDLEPEGRVTPILIRQYLKLNARFLGFSVDPSFGDVIDGLVLCDLTQLEPRTAARYMGAEGAASFLEHHQLTLGARRLLPPPDSSSDTRAS